MKINIANWKTTVSGLVIVAAYVVKVTNPEYALACDAVLAAGAAGVGIFAKDNDVTGGTVKQP
jgi:hypothetical protein